MSYKTVVTFEFNNHPFISQVDNIDDVKKLVAQSPIDLPHTAEVIRTVNIIDLNKSAKNSFFTKKAIDGHPIVSSLDGGKFSFIYPNLVYADDIKKYLMEQYGSTFDFRPSNDFTGVPMIFDIIEHSSVGLRNPKTGMPTYQKWHSVLWRALTDKEVVVDKNMNQLWPANTGKPPVELVNLLKKRTEKIH